MMQPYAASDLSFEDLNATTHTMLAQRHHYATTLEQLKELFHTCATSAPPAIYQGLCQQWMTESYPLFQERIPVQRAEITLTDQDVQLRKLATRKLEKRFWFSKSDGGSGCPESGKIWLDKRELKIPKYGLQSQFWYFNPTKNPKKILTSPVCDYTPSFRQIIPLTERKWVYNNSIRIPLRNAITPDFYHTLYAEYATPELSTESSIATIAAAYQKVYADVYEIPDIKVNIQKHFELWMDQIAGWRKDLPQKQWENIVNDYITEKEMLVDGTTLRSYAQQAEWSSLS